ncbi:MAG: hypothetical protein Q8K33_24220 [Cypionkella sp.]|nr:hypothetical protein [Cypionkella sp.]MDP2051930.1 hypothetical protein [Cypionkella sp.]
MKVVIPTPVLSVNYAKDPAAFGYSNATDSPEWAVGTTYAAGDRVIVDALQSTFESLVAGNIGHAPVLAPATSTFWVRVGSSNAWKPFDKVVSSPLIGYTAASQQLDLMNFRLTSMGRFSTICVLSTEAGKVRVAYSPDGGTTTTYDQTRTAVNTEPVIDLWTYFFEKLNQTRDFIFDDIDGYGATSAAQITITLDNASTGVAVTCGEIIVGPAFDIGDCHAGARLELNDYSRKERNEFGDLTLVERAYSYTGSFDIEIAKAFRNTVQSLMVDIRATPCVFYPSASDANDGLIVYGFEKTFAINYDTPERAYASLVVEGLT